MHNLRKSTSCSLANKATHLVLVGLCQLTQTCLVKDAHYHMLELCPMLIYTLVKLVHTSDIVSLVHCLLQLAVYYFEVVLQHRVVMLATLVNIAIDKRAEFNC